jgi:hypothetical protein
VSYKTDRPRRRPVLNGSRGLREITSAWCAGPAEERQIDRIGHRLVSRVARMEVVAPIEALEELLRIARIARGLVEIDDAIVGVAGPNPLVECLALRLADVGVVRRAPERRQSPSHNLESAGVRARDQLLVRGDEILGKGMRPRARQECRPRRADRG